MERETHHVAVVAVSVIAVAVIVVAVAVAVVVVVVSTFITLQCNRVFHLINWGNVLESK